MIYSDVTGNIDSCSSYVCGFFYVYKPMILVLKYVEEEKNLWK